MKNFNQKANYPFTYGDKNTGEVRLSDYIVSAAKNERVQKHLSSVAVALLTIGMYSRPASAIPPEYGEAANEILNQAGAAVPPIGAIKGQLPVPQVNPQCFTTAMPIEQQHLIAAQQAGQIGAMPGAVIAQTGPTNPPVFYIPNKPKSVTPRAVNTVAFTTALGVICINAAWGEPVAILMCSSGLMGLAYKLGKEVAIFMAKNLAV